MRYAGYIRVSTDMQIESWSLEAQEYIIQEWVDARGGELVHVYADKGASGLTLDRPAFQEMQRDALNGKFDAVVVHRFDRLSRNRIDAIALKTLFRHDWGVKVYSCTEPSEEDEDDDGAVFENLMEVFAEWQSRILADEIRKAAYLRHLRGLYLAPTPAYGYSKDKQGHLVINPYEAEAVRLAFHEYSSGSYSIAEIANILNQAGYRTRRKRFFTKGTVHDMLRNRVYMGEVSYRETSYKEDGTRYFPTPRQWRKGIHQPIIDMKTWEACQRTGRQRATPRANRQKKKIYLLGKLVFCDRCLSRPPFNPLPSHGKMHARTHNLHETSYYFCPSKDRGGWCGQHSVPTDIVETQVIDILKYLKPPSNWRDEIAAGISEKLDDHRIAKRIDEIKSFLLETEAITDYRKIGNIQAIIEQRDKAQKTLKALLPAMDLAQEAQQSLKILMDFERYWMECDGDPQKRRDLITLVIKEVHIRDDDVVRIIFRPNHPLVNHLSDKLIESERERKYIRSIQDMIRSFEDWKYGDGV